MKTHPIQWLGAYYDGELNPEKNQQIKEHLETCQDCQKQLDQIAYLSAILHKVPEVAPLQPVDIFIEQVVTKLPEKKSQNPGITWQVSWWMPPMILVSGWSFLQALFFMSGLLLQLKPFENISQFSSGSQTILEEFFSFALLPAAYTWLSPIWHLLPGSDAIYILLLNLIASCVCAILLASWLASWFTYHRHLQVSIIQENRAL